MGQAKKRGSLSQRLAQARQRDELEEHSQEPERHFGFNRLRTKDELPSDMPADALVCMVSNIVVANHEALCQQSGLKFQLGDWFVSVGEHAATKVHGPFQTIDEAYEFARINFNAVRFVIFDC
ncbi:hypothetical protein [Massilia antarctica]|uniref:hypothetical protein n=1 Tax=Massilia antarctica TaxID=2765360 RepID=UPI00226D436C|nr:hypothetical protein [Massilia sp. H27-R4]MCY0915294.1 hypothetical protein [Massilia sp. H27-R4]